MKLHTDIIAICDYALVSKENKLSVIGIFDEIKSANFPAGLAKGFLVATVSGLPNQQYNLSLKIEDAMKKDVLQPLNLAMTTSASGRSNIIVELVGAAFPEAGKYSFKIFNEQEEIGSTQLTVIRVKEDKHSTVKLSN